MGMELAAQRAVGTLSRSFSRLSGKKTGCNPAPGSRAIPAALAGKLLSCSSSRQPGRNPPPAASRLWEAAVLSARGSVGRLRERLGMVGKGPERGAEGCGWRL